MTYNQQDQPLRATLQSAWNPWVISLVKLAQFHGLNKKSDQKMGQSTTFIYFVMLMIFLCIHHNADSTLEPLNKSFPLTVGFGNPDMYLGAKLHKTRLNNGI